MRNGTGTLPGLNLVALRTYLGNRLPGGLRGGLSAELIAGGRSNLTYLLDDGRQRWVLRRPPLGHVLETAHDMGREYHVLSALAPTPVPVPRTFLFCTDQSVIGVPFYLMEYADGTIYRTAEQLGHVSPETGQAVADALVDTLAVLHDIEPASVGLSDLGRADGYLERQVRRWGTQLAASRSRDIPGIAELGERLAKGLPRSSRTTLVHGDYRLDNVVLEEHAGVPRVRAVLDWEMATIGDPLTDLASMLVWWDGIAGLNSPVAAVPGEWQAFPPGSRLLERYAADQDVPVGTMGWYLGFAYYKVAAIFESIHFRDLRGQTVGGGFELLAGLVGPLVARGHQALDG
ncbi:phosphotransferase family protein [Kribbella pittospori]|uniref:Phosphotransferase family protein n=1 Tax=Kribbella pittospori TaxID=722689 RepID=A0A4R0KTB0_9ACTN|nr:phosphotransferase family protein [Kribbella pittospori]TCC63267.1 phosphotransferase family protein [Kribbella pittospori]